MNIQEAYGEHVFIEVDLPVVKDGEEVGVYFEITGMDKLREVNILAAQFYSLNGYLFLPEHDFYGSNRPQEYNCFLMACQAFYLIKGQS